jgi:hypothetical protein
MKTLGVLMLSLTLGCGGATSPADAGHDAARDTIDAGALDVGTDAPVSDAFVPQVGCAGRDYLFCEDFESGAGTALPSGWVVGGGWMDGDPSVSSSVAHTGTRSLRSATAMSGQHRAEHPLDALGAARGHHWGRVFYRVATPAFVPASGVVHNTMVGLLGSTECRVVDTVESTSGAHQFLFNIPDDSCCVGSGYDFRSYDGDWHCAEWHVDAEAQSFQFFFDGTEVTDLTFTRSDSNAHIESFAAIALGWRNYQTATTPYESYFDDLALDDARIGCD